MGIGAINPNMKTGQCEVCDRETVTITDTNGDSKTIALIIRLHYGNMWFCDECWAKEQAATAENYTPAKVQERVDAVNDAVKESQKIDSTIQVRTDLFNAATTSILELKQSIDSDSAITNKPYRLAEVLKERFEHYKQVVFELNLKVAEAGNQQKAIQIYLNTLANQLRAEEREKLRIQDISYQPTKVKPTVRKVSTSQTSKKTKFDKAEVRKYASELGLPEFTLTMLCVQKGLTPEAVANVLRRTIKEGKSEAEPSTKE